MKKGQLISLDFIMSLVLVVLAIGIIMQLSEVENYNFKDKELKDETQAIGKAASVLLVNSPRTTCELVDYRDENKILSYLSNCIPEWAVPTANCGGSLSACKTWDKYGKIRRAFKPILKEFLGLPANYSCYIKVTGGKPSGNALLLTDCELSPPALAKNVYAIDLSVLIHNEVSPGTGKTLTVSKTELERCMQNDAANCYLFPATIKFLVWKNE
ncbi:MAG: hypothetical protein ABH986_00925 [archaeon]